MEIKSIERKELNPAKLRSLFFRLANSVKSNVPVIGTYESDKTGLQAQFVMEGMTIGLTMFDLSKIAV